jgi:hypothetical protein
MEKINNLYALQVDSATFISTDITAINSLAISKKLLGHVEQIGTSRVEIPLQTIGENSVLECDRCRWTGSSLTTKLETLGSLNPVKIDTCPECGHHEFKTL